MKTLTGYALNLLLLPSVDGPIPAVEVVILIDEPRDGQTAVRFVASPDNLHALACYLTTIADEASAASDAGGYLPPPTDPDPKPPAPAEAVA